MKNKTETTHKPASYAPTTGSPSAKPVGVTAPAKQKGGNITKARN